MLDSWQDIVGNRQVRRSAIVGLCGKVNENRISCYQRRKEHRAQKENLNGN